MDGQTALRQYEQRIMDELTDAKERFDYLQVLLGTSCIPEEDRKLLIRQSHIMELYLDVLTERTTRFTSNSLKRAHQATQAAALGRSSGRIFLRSVTSSVSAHRTGHSPVSAHQV